MTSRKSFKKNDSVSYQEKMIKEVSQTVGIPEEALSLLVRKEKVMYHHGDFNRKELIKLAKDFKKESEKKE